MLQGMLGFSIFAGTLGIFTLGTGVLEAGKELGSLAPSAILGVIVCVCFWMLKKLYDDKNKTDNKLQETFALHIKTTTESINAMREQTLALKEVRINSELCRDLSTLKAQQLQKKIEADRISSNQVNNNPPTFGSK